MIIGMLVILGLVLAYANGANDNFKGVATLFGSATTDYKRALLWGSATTFLGSFAALVLSGGLISTFSGKGLVPDAVLASQSFAIAVALGAGFTVLLATRLGFPISTTHAITGSLVGAGIMGSPSGVNFSKLGSAFFMPLAVSPLLALSAAALLYPLLRRLRLAMGVGTETCLCVGTTVIGPASAVVVGQGNTLLLTDGGTLPVVSIADNAVCRDLYTGSVCGVSARTLLDGVHYLSAGAVSFARGLNDTPKIAAILLLAQSVSPSHSIILVALAMVTGGFLSARRVAERMSLRITSMNAGQGFSANGITTGLVLGASLLGLPVSTTHVSCGALFGIGAVTGNAQWKTIASILGAWVITLPVAFALSASAYFVVHGVLQ